MASDTDPDPRPDPDRDADTDADPYRDADPDTGPDPDRDADPDPVSVTVYSRDHCHLCEEAIESLERAGSAADVPVAVEEVDVDEDAELRDEYGDRVPYVLVDGRPAFKYRVDPDEARRRLRDAAEGE